MDRPAMAHHHHTNGYSAQARFLSNTVKVASGAFAVLAGAYVVSKLKEKHGLEERLERLERIAATLEKDEGKQAV